MNSQASTTSIDDLPDGCLQEILKRVGNAPLPLACPSKKDRLSSSCGVRHPLQCAFVCQRWRATVDGAVTSLVFPRQSTLDAEALVKTTPRFRQLASLRLYSRTWGSSSYDIKAFLGDLAAATPGLSDLVLDIGLAGTGPLVESGATVSTLLAWKSLRTLNLGLELCQKLCAENLEGILDLLKILQRDASLQELTVVLGLELTVRAGHEARILAGLDAVRSCTSLKHLTLYVSSIAPFEAICVRLRRLTSLNTLRIVTSHGPTASLSGIAPLRSLRLVMLAEAALPETLGSLRGLTSLDVCHASVLTRLPDSIGDLSALRQLYVAGCAEIRALPEALGALQWLEVLSLEHCKVLGRLPASLGSLRALSDLRVNNCANLSGLPESLGGLRQLTSLKVTNCRHVAVLPESIAGLRRLMLLDLSGCASLRFLPDALATLTALEVLEVSACTDLMQLPRGMMLRESELRVLGAYECTSLLLPDGLPGLPALTKLMWGIPPEKRLTYIVIEKPLEAWDRHRVSNASVLSALREKGCEIRGDDVDAVRRARELRGPLSYPPQQMLNWDRRMVVNYEPSNE